MRHFPLITAGLTAAATLAAAGGAAAEADYINNCRQSARSDAEQIACLEDAVRALTGAATPSASVAARMDASPAPGSAPAAPQAVAAVEGPEAPAASGLGAEQVAARLDRENTDPDKKKEKESLTASVSDFAVAADGDYILFLDNGHVWRQSAKANARVRLYPGKKYTVTIEEGWLSGYRLTVNEIKRTFNAERIK